MSVFFRAAAGAAICTALAFPSQATGPVASPSPKGAWAWVLPAQYGGSDSKGEDSPAVMSRTLQADLRLVAARAGLTVPQAQALLKSRRVDPRATRLIVLLIEDQAEDCGQMPQPYHLTCLIDGYGEVAEALPRIGDYAPVRQALDRVTRELAQIARAHRDRTRAALPPREGRPRSTSFRGVVGAAPRQQARAALARIKGLLIRSAPDSDPRAVHYHRIAAAFDAGALLMRS